MKYIQLLLVSELLFLSSSCGSAEAIKRYNYPITKYALEKAVLKVINSNPNIAVDTTESKVIVRRNSGDPNDTSTFTINLSDFHSPDSASVARYLDGEIRIKIKVGETDNNYQFRYLGDEKYWKTAKSSAIFIQYVRDKHGNSISQGKNKNGEFASKMAKEFTSLFEREVVYKIDKELKIKHTID